MSLAAVNTTDPFASTLRYVTRPYQRGVASLPLTLGAAAAGISNFLGYTFAPFQSQFGIQTSALEVSYVIALRAQLGDGPVTLAVTYTNDDGTAISEVLVPAGTLPGTSFVVPMPNHGGLAMLDTLQEKPAPVPGAAAGPDKWGVTALVGNAARVLALCSGEQQIIDAVARDVAQQRHLMTARGKSLDLIGESLEVPRFLPAPYRLDLDTSTVGLYHLDDVIAPVIDATSNHPGTSHGAVRGIAGKIGNCAQITAAGGLTIPDDSAFIIPSATSFTIEMFVETRTIKKGSKSFLAVKRPRPASSAGPGWALTLEGIADSVAMIRFSLTDRAGQVVEVLSAEQKITGWIHVAGVLDGVKKTVSVFLNGVRLASQAFTSLEEIQNCSDIGLGSDRSGNALMDGFLDEVRFSNAAINDFKKVIGGAPYVVDAATIALYHLDETDDWIDDATAKHYAINHGAKRGVQARFDLGVSFSGDPLPEARCDSEMEFQHQVKAGLWDRTQGGAEVTAGPYLRFGYRQGAISLAGLTGEPQPVMVNDASTIDANVRGRVTTACYGFVPTDLDQTISRFQENGRTAQEAIDYFGDWNGEPDSFYLVQYKAHKITVAHESCAGIMAPSSWIQISNSPDFAVDAKTSLTVEAFIKPQDISDVYPRAIAASRSSSLRDGDPNVSEAGWALSLCTCDCIPNNLRWTLGDESGNLVIVVADMDLADGSFHHVAGVLDRDASSALLYVDGIEVAKQPTTKLGAITSLNDIFVGNNPLLAAPYAGVVDEIRISRAARRTFHPVLGESDNRYRQRLAIFWPYRIPSAIVLERGARALSLPVSSTVADVTANSTELLLSDSSPSDNGQLTILETDSARFSASRKFQIIPARLNPGDSIAKDGTSPANEVKATGSYSFHTEALIRHDDVAGLSFVSEGSRWMVLRALQGLDALNAALQKVSAATVIAIQSAWSPSAGGLKAQGRSLNISLSSAGPGIDLGKVAALAHEIGIDYVAYDAASLLVRLSFAPGADLDLQGPSVVAPGAAVTISIARPQVLTAVSFVFRILRCGPGDGNLIQSPTDTATSRTFTGTALGSVTVTVQCLLRDGSSLYGIHPITIAPDTLDGCVVLGGDGSSDVSETTASLPAEDDFEEAYLVRANNAQIDYASESARKMQLPLENALLNLATLAAAEPGAPRINVLAAYDPAATNLQSVGRGLIVAPSSGNLLASRLGALAYRAGFSFIQRRRYPPSVYVSVRPGPRFQIIRSPIQRLWPNARISGLGEFMAREFSAAGPPEANFTPAMLQVYTAAGVSFAAGVSNQVQANLATALTALVAILKADGFNDTLQVLTGFTPSAADLTKVGRALLIQHPVVPADRLAGYSLAAGFAFVQHRTNTPAGSAVYVAVYATGAIPPQLFSDDDVVLNMLLELSIRPELPVVGSLDWTDTACCPAGASLSTALSPTVTPNMFVHKVLKGTASGVVTVVASFSRNDAAEPYQFIVQSRLPEGVEPKLTKDQYDDLMNFFSEYDPVGVEVVTKGIRPYVHGFPRPSRWDEIPTYATFPNYRVGR